MFLCKFVYILYTNENPLGSCQFGGNRWTGITQSTHYGDGLEHRLIKHEQQHARLKAGKWRGEGLHAHIKVEMTHYPLV